MKQLGLIALLAVGMLLVGCGSSNNNSDNVNGHWTANLTDQSGNPVFSFTTDLNQNSGSTVTGTNLNFTTATPCFGSDSTETGGFSFSGNFNGQATGAFTLTIQSGTTNSNGNNTLNLQGTLNNNNTVSGTWVLSGNGAGCTGSGNFTMNRG